MQITFRVIASDTSVEAETRSLCDWLRLEPGIRRYANISMGSSTAPVPGAQGPVLDLVSLLVSSGFSAASLGVSIDTWRRQRQAHPTVSVERDGTTVMIEGSVLEARRLLEDLLRDPDEDPDAGGAGGGDSE